MKNIINNDKLQNVNNKKISLKDERNNKNNNRFGV